MNTDSTSSDSTDSITAKYKTIAEAAVKRLAKNARVRRNLPGGGRLRMDRQLPFLCIHRGNEIDVGTPQLVTTEAAYLFASSSPEHHAGLSLLCRSITAAMQEHFGTFLLIEVWANNELDQQNPGRPAFEIVALDSESIPTTMAGFEKALSSITLNRRSARVTRRAEDIHVARGLPDLLSGCDDLGTSCGCTLGLIVKPIYRDRSSNMVFPVVLQELRWQLATAYRKTVAKFTGKRSGKEKSHYDTYGPSTLVKATRLIDQQLCEVSESFDFLLQVTPINAEEAGEGFKESGDRELPPLRYRQLPYHPNLLKRHLFAIEIERIEDPTLAHLFWEKQDELDRKLTSLRDLHLPELSLQTGPQPFNVLPNSLQLYGRPGPSLIQLAKKILKHDSQSRKKKRRQSKTFVNAESLVAAAREEIDEYHTQMSEFYPTVEVSDSIAAGIMVSQSRLMIDRGIKIPFQRVKPLLHHEIGTHLLTYFNGRCQPFRQLYAGLAGYEELQEGLAVLSEYLVGGLTRKRMRTLAARVLAVHWMTSGKSFSYVFKRLHNRYQFSRHRAFTTSLRVFRAGGLTKDLIYLRGLRDLLNYLSKGHDIEPLYVGKIGLQHIPYVQELRRRGIIEPPRILPRFLNDNSVRERLAACRGKTVLDLLETD